MMAPSIFSGEFLEHCQERLITCFEHFFSSQQTSPIIRDACFYSFLNGGKRLRPMLVYASGLMCGVDWQPLDVPACAIELIHTYSLIHDDLPAMDNADERRGQPSCHKKFGEANAILVGDGLLTFAFELLSQGPLYGLNAQQCIAMQQTLSRASGIQGIIYGQVLDLTSTNQKMDMELIKQVHELKTARLFQAALKLGALASTYYQDETLLENLTVLGQKLGLAFQILDDLADEEEDKHAKNVLSWLNIMNHQETCEYVASLERECLMLINQLPGNKEYMLWLITKIFHQGPTHG